jgi:hypothetical protein
MTWDESITRREAHLRPVRTQVGWSGVGRSHSKINKKRKKEVFLYYFLNKR